MNSAKMGILLLADGTSLRMDEDDAESYLELQDPCGHSSTCMLRLWGYGTRSLGLLFTDDPPCCVPPNPTANFLATHFRRPHYAPTTHIRGSVFLFDVKKSLPNSIVAEMRRCVGSPQMAHLYQLGQTPYLADLTLINQERTNLAIQSVRDHAAESAANLRTRWKNGELVDGKRTVKRTLRAIKGLEQWLCFRAETSSSEAWEVYQTNLGLFANLCSFSEEECARLDAVRRANPADELWATANSLAISIWEPTPCLVSDEERRRLLREVD